MTYHLRNIVVGARPAPWVVSSDINVQLRL